VAMPDRRKFAAPVLAQAVSFVAVLVIGGFTGQSAGHSPGPAPGSATPTPQTGATSPGGAKEHQSALAVQVPVDAAVGGVALRIPVRVLNSRTLFDAASGTLSPNAQNTQLGWNKPLAAGTYQVCAQPPAGLRFTEKNTGVLPGWSCTLASVAQGSQTQVTFHLTPDVP
jgi:hypothetical protein